MKTLGVAGGFLLGLTFVCTQMTPSFAQTTREYINACIKAQCDPAYRAKMDTCTAGMGPADKDRVIACTTDALKQSTGCQKNCAAQAYDKLRN